MQAVLDDALHNHRGKNRMSHFVHGRYAYLCEAENPYSANPNENSIKILKSNILNNNFSVTIATYFR